MYLLHNFLNLRLLQSCHAESFLHSILVFSLSFSSGKHTICQILCLFFPFFSPLSLSISLGKHMFQFLLEMRYIGSNFFDTLKSSFFCAVSSQFVKFQNFQVGIIFIRILVALFCCFQISNDCKLLCYLYTDFFLCYLLFYPF